MRVRAAVLVLLDRAAGESGSGDDRCAALEAPITLRLAGPCYYIRAPRYVDGWASVASVASIVIEPVHVPNVSLSSL